MATANYLMEYCLIPNILEEVKAGRNTLQSLIDIEWMKVNLERDVTCGQPPCDYDQWNHPLNLFPIYREVMRTGVSV